MLDTRRTIDDVPWVFLDFETTGLAPRWGDRVCEVAALRYEFGEPVDAVQQLINPQRPMGAGALAVHGLTDEMLRVAPPFAQAAPALLELLQDAVLICHNAPFDLGFLAAELAPLGMEMPSSPTLDTLRLARCSLRLSSYALGSLSQALGVQVEGRAHRAMVDVLLTHGVFERLVDHLWSRGVRRVEDYVVAQGGPIVVEPAPAIEIPPLVAQALRESCLLRLCYRTGAGLETQRMVRPLTISVAGGQVSLVAHCYLRDARRHFRLDRILTMELVTDRHVTDQANHALTTPPDDLPDCSEE
jgi:DNA polymerase-3 subunit epsilon